MVGKRPGRPVKSKIRDRMQEIVDALGVTYGYEIYKVYQDAFEPIDLRSMYYHLNKGVSLKEFKEIGVEVVKGNFTWGDKGIRKYYVLGENSTERASDDIHIIIKTLGLKYRKPDKFTVKK